jgi:hypothetical protein
VYVVVGEEGVVSLESKKDLSGLSNFEYVIPKRGIRASYTCEFLIVEDNIPSIIEPH